jgi:hypothetical protein
MEAKPTSGKNLTGASPCHSPLATERAAGARTTHRFFFPSNSYSARYSCATLWPGSR